MGNAPHIFLAPAGGHSHVRARGRNLWCKDSSPLDPHQKHGGRHPSPIPPRGTKGRDCGPSPLETPPGARRGSGSGKKGRGRPVWNIGVRRTFWCGDTVLGGIGIAQPVGDFWIWSAVCDGQPPVLGELTALPGNSSLSAFSFVPCPARFLLQDKKKMWGTFCTAKPCLPVPHSGTVVHPCGASPHILGPPFQGEPFKGALQWPNVNPPPI